MATVSLDEAQARLPHLLQKLQPGEEITITDRGQPLAQVKKVDAQQRQPRKAGSAKGLLVIVQEDDEHLADFAEYME